MLRILPYIVVLAVWLYGMVDCALANRDEVRGFRKATWFLVSVLPLVGALLWFAFGRPLRSAPPGAGSTGRGRRPTAPDDDPDFLRGL